MKRMSTLRWQSSALSAGKRNAAVFNPARDSATRKLPSPALAATVWAGQRRTTGLMYLHLLNEPATRCPGRATAAALIAVAIGDDTSISIYIQSRLGGYSSAFADRTGGLFWLKADQPTQSRPATGTAGYRRSVGDAVLFALTVDAAEVNSPGGFNDLISAQLSARCDR